MEGLKLMLLVIFVEEGGLKLNWLLPMFEPRLGLLSSLASGMLFLEGRSKAFGPCELSEEDIRGWTSTCRVCWRVMVV